MKSLLYALMLVILFCACKKTSEHNIKDDITGTWKLVEYRGDTSIPAPPVLDGTLLVLTPNNTYEFKIFFDRTVQTGTYELGRKMECNGGRTTDFIITHSDTGNGEAFIFLNNDELCITTTNCSSPNPLTTVYHRL